ncbi:MAG: DUF4838 domain-containing protein [Verrucomicrobiae bacterium]|nr:DUF4838 domain-containing protein [Verrucomicrobiae bacterium]
MHSKIQKAVSVGARKRVGLGCKVLNWILIAGTAATAPCAFAMNHALVKDGNPESCVVLEENAGPVERHAATELADYLKKASGARVAIQSIPSETLYNIYLGLSDSKTMRFSGAMKTALTKIDSQGYMLAADKEGLRIVGRQPIGVLYGAYEILKRQADIRWFAPGDEFEYCPNKPTIFVPAQIVVSNPSFKFRYVGINCARASLATWNWLVRNGMTIQVPKGPYRTHQGEYEKRGAEILGGGHSFIHLLDDKLFDEHPEYFGLRDERRVKQRRQDGKKDSCQPCTSNPKVAEIMAESLEKWLHILPQKSHYIIGNNDYTRWCQCDKCARLDPVEEQEKNFVGTRYFTLVNQIAKKVYASLPDADLWAWAYQNYQEPPAGIVPDQRLTIQVCLNGRCYRHAMADETCAANDRFRNILSSWRRFGNPILTYEYQFDESFMKKEIDRVAAWYIPYEHVFCQDIKYYHRLGIRGFRLTAIPPDGKFCPVFDKRILKESWYAMWQLMYLSAQMAWDVNADYDRLVEDMGTKYYGKAWLAMKQYREQLIKMYEETPGDFCLSTPKRSLGKCLEKPGVDLRLLDEAEKMAADDPTSIKRIKRDREFFQLCWPPLHEEFLAARPNQIHINKRMDKIVVDGEFAETDWKKSEFTDNFIVLDGKTANPQTFVKMLYDEDNIYLAIEAMEPDPSKMKINLCAHDGALWQDSSLEVFIAAPGMNNQYAHVVVNPKEVVYDSMVVDGSQFEDLNFDAGMEVKAKVMFDRWVTEIRIPAAALGVKIRDGEAWRINVARNRHLVDGTSQNSSWSGGVFHGANYFRSVFFGKNFCLKMTHL